MAAATIEDLEFFLDRGLGAYTVPRALRAASWRLTTMDERYGKERSQHVSDQRWIADASGRGARAAREGPTGDMMPR